MLRPLLALSVLLLSLGSIFAVVGIAHSQPGFPRDSMRCGDAMQCPYRGHGSPLYHFPFGDEHNLHPNEESLRPESTEPKTTPVADATETISPALETESNTSAEENSELNESSTEDEIVVSETVVVETFVAGRFVAGSVSTAPVVELAAEPVAEAVVEGGVVYAASIESEDDELSSTTEDRSIVDVLTDVVELVTNEYLYLNSSASNDIDPYGYKNNVNEKDLVPHIKISYSRKAFLTKLNKRVHCTPQMELGLYLVARGLDVRDRVTQWTRDYKLERLAIRVVPPDKPAVVASNPVEDPTSSAHGRQLLLGFARGLNQFGVLIQGASRQLEGLVHDGATLQADAHSGTIETR